MQWFEVLYVVLTGLVFRVILPLGITVLAIYLLRKADHRWKKEAEKAQLEKPLCWEVKSCSMEQMRNCPALVSPEPCWQVRRLANGNLSQECEGCQVYHQSPLPVPIHL